MHRSIWIFRSGHGGDAVWRSSGYFADFPASRIKPVLSQAGMDSINWWYAEITSELEPRAVIAELVSSNRGRDLIQPFSEM
jgi:hypothetical protein